MKKNCVQVFRKVIIYKAYAKMLNDLEYKHKMTIINSLLTQVTFKYIK